MKPTLDDLRVALHEQANLTPYPDVDALVAGARRRVALTRRRRLAVLSSATGAILLVAGLMARTGSARRAIPQPAEPGLGNFSVNAGGAGFPDFFQGVRRVTVLDAPMLARMKGSISIPTTPGEQLSVQMTCTRPKDLARTPGTAPKAPKGSWFSQMEVNFTGLGGKRIARCGVPGATGELSGVATGDVIGVATGATTTVSADVSLAPDYTPSVAAPKGAKIHAAIYETVPWHEYPFPPPPTGVKAPVWHTVRSLPDGTPDGTAVSGALNRQIQGPTSAANANDALSIGWPYDPRSRLVLEVRGPGRLRVLINGNNISAGILNGSTATAWSWSTPLRDGYLTYWTYEQVDTAFPLDPQIVTLPGATFPVPKLGAMVSLVIIPQDFTGPDWRVIYEPLVKGR